ncbi:LysR family transcriptional regulator [Ktedonosporobacter rubrisoli]|uniref:LysR family transcriptional regulator n=1 Tax=Ktedonosporobacter rubrisoli TaxID=2509675 RepID=A0A4P6JWP6_KTERU|nr:LysR family transcriptional regulator [Ktedonosporobacter rubrisoli]QBD79446.1 LysR family transcriptional regulator [Ktedonosporobacter rubrisoli]
MNFSQLQSVVALAETGSFTEAAYAIDLTQSAVSYAIAALERELGITIFERNRKGGVVLTGVGKKIMPHVRALLAQAEAIEQEARAARGEAAGKVRVGNIESLVAPELFASLLTHFQRQHPEIEVVLFNGSMHEVGEWVESSIIDVGFMLMPANGLDGQLLLTDELYALVSPEHRLGKRKAVTQSDLREESFILEKTHCMRLFMQLAGFGPMRIRYQASDSATILAMVREGLGVSLTPRMVLPKKLEGVVALPFDPPQHIKIGLVTRSQELAPRGARLFIQTARTWMQEQAAALALQP